MIKAIHDFARLFKASITLNEDLVLRKGDRYFLLNGDLKKAVSKGFFYAGCYLGKTKNEEFIPGFELLRMLSKEDANRVLVDGKTEWLFICGRDIFKQGIVAAKGSNRKDDFALVLNRRNECLGFGKIVCDLNESRKGVAIKNVLDVGDFLRREARAP
jgi:ribosome biogenesis protein Nip4